MVIPVLTGGDTRHNSLVIPQQHMPPSCDDRLGKLQYFEVEHRGLEPRNQLAVQVVLGSASVYHYCGRDAIGGGVPTCRRDGRENTPSIERRSVGVAVGVEDGRGAGGRLYAGRRCYMCAVWAWPVHTLLVW